MFTLNKDVIQEKIQIFFLNLRGLFHHLTELASLSTLSAIGTEAIPAVASGQCHPGCFGHFQNFAARFRHSNSLTVRFSSEDIIALEEHIAVGCIHHNNLVEERSAQR
ncbi:hypothetical protein CAEBREN_14976 [Caenorhabditis brenneri]|uniref:Uncharacterized protein n=1 Tax=Caenorhabditis brenneri TaxID=135651 RepID=G0MW27_CAEBE|nr:hypothetical protein CAEBREN_14976 [Caenorhabditis brenneri]